MKRKRKIYRLTTTMRGRLLFVLCGIGLLFFALVGNLFFRTFIQGGQFRTAVLRNQGENSSNIEFERGKIYDRNGNLLATNEKLYRLILEPKNILVADGMYEQTTIDALVKYLNLNEDKLKKVVEANKDSYYVKYKDNLTYDQVGKLMDLMNLSKKNVADAKTEAMKDKIREAKKIVGVSFEEKYKRVYPYGSLACRALGFTSSGNVGNWGIEQYYNNTLNGTNGRSYYYYDDNLNREQTVINPVDGNSVVSTIDMQIQQIIENKIKLFDDVVGSKETSVLVMNPQNGEILGMASSNPYNLNKPQDEDLLKGMYSEEEIAKMKENSKKKEEETTTEKKDKGSEEDTEAEEDSEDKKTIYDAFFELWRNPIISDTHEPGSTYKPFTVSAGLESGVLTGNESYYCTGSLAVDGHSIGCSHVHENISLKDAVAKSCNVSMMNIAFSEGADIFYRYQRLFGFGKKTGVDLPGEADTAGLIYNQNNYQNSVTLATNSFGQNFNTTMIQLASGFESLINGGKYYQPHIVKQIQNSKGDVIKNVDSNLVHETVSEETSRKIRSYLEETVKSGTGVKAQLDGYSVGGKTGTAEKIPRDKKNYYVSFVGFTPVDNPQVMIYVTIDEPNVDNQATARTAVELQKACMKDIVNVMGIAPTEKVEEKTEEQKEIEEENMDDLELALRDQDQNSEDSDSTEDTDNTEDSNDNQNTGNTEDSNDNQNTGNDEDKNQSGNQSETGESDQSEQKQIIASTQKSSETDHAQ